MSTETSNVQLKFVKAEADYEQEMVLVDIEFINNSLVNINYPKIFVKLELYDAAKDKVYVLHKTGFVAGDVPAGTVGAGICVFIIEKYHNYEADNSKITILGWLP